MRMGVKKTNPRIGRLLWGRIFPGGLCLLILVSTSVQAADRREFFGVATERWYVQAAQEAVSPDGSGFSEWDSGLYLDLGYNLNTNFPGNDLWRSKSTTFKVNTPQVNMAMGYAEKAATSQSRWGMAFGIQSGVDTENLVTEPPPASNEPIASADWMRHLYRANGTYLLSVGKGLSVTAGLINSYIGYESYLAIQNLNYTRAYMLDFVPYFLLGAQADYSVTDTLDLSLVVAGGWNYLTQPNHTPSYGLQAAWQLLPQVRFVQNLYYGPDQEDTGMEFWRFFSDSIIEWKNDRFTVAAAFDVGTEKQAEVPGKPRYDWMAGSVWLGWHIDGPWTLGVRPEIYRDPDGLGTGSVQTIQACTGTLEYSFSPIKANTMVIALEYRYDRSTGSDGGFYNGEDNELVPDQHQLLFSLMWAFGP
jgi:hypothetical protein